MPELNEKILIVYGDEIVRESLTTLMGGEGRGSGSFKQTMGKWGSM
jgi:hypothetical protein